MGQMSIPSGPGYSSPMHGWKARMIAVMAGIGIGLLATFIVAQRDERKTRFLMGRYGLNCASPEYDHVAYLAALDEADKRAADALTVLNQGTGHAVPLSAERKAYLEAKRVHLRMLGDLVTQYVRGGHVKRIQCIGDQFLNVDLTYPTFSEIEEQKQFARVWREYERLRQFSWTTTGISALGAILGPSTTLLLFVLNGRRERRLADQRIVRPGG